jgi:hypothetical protein
LSTIKKAPLTFVVGFCVLAVLIALGEYTWIFKEWVSRKDDLINQKDGVISVLEKKLAATSQPAIPSPQSTGPATASGSGGIANTGAGNTFNTGRPAAAGETEKK